MENVNLLDKNAWDDSALIRSWNQALREYRVKPLRDKARRLKYHSIHARGEKVEDVLRQQEQELLKEAAQEVVDEETVVDAEDNDPVAGDVGGDKSEVTTSKFPQDQQSTNQLRGVEQQMNVELQDKRMDVDDNADEGVGESSYATGPNLPHQLLDGKGTDNKPLKNLMMSWYYAGYYTGFVEGQTAARQNGGGKET